LGRAVTGSGKGSIAGWESTKTGRDCSGIGNDATRTTSTSLWAACEGWAEVTIAGPGCNNWPGVIREGADVSVWIELDDPTTAGDNWDPVW